MAKPVDVNMSESEETNGNGQSVDLSQIAKCIERLKTLNESDVMLDSKNIDEEMDIDDDFRSESSIRYECRNVSKMKESLQNLSDPVMVRNLPWRILLMLRPSNTSDPTNKSLGFFLQCNGENISNSWSIQANAELRLLNYMSPEKTITKKITHLFFNKENDWGFSVFITWKDLLDPSKGFIKDDTIIAECKVAADAPHGVDWDSKKLTGYVGLKNQGATCYMNSLLQSLYFCTKLRKAVYQMPTEGEDANKNVPLALQRVFYELQTLDRSVATKKLTRSFGWDTLDSFMQHDVQELTRVLLDNIETKMKGSAVEGVIPTLFEGKMLSYLKCKHINYISCRSESFYDIQLSIKGKKNIFESFKEYVAIETLDGENKYDAGKHGLQEAEKGVIFTHFPPILHLHLMRFSFDFSTETNIKINDRYEFPARLNLDPFLQKPEPQPAVYILHAVLVHSGDNHGGHYVVYINPLGDGNWCKFDDEVVCRCSSKEAIQLNFGGTEEELAVRNCTNAYMLVYIRETHLESILKPMDKYEIPLEMQEKLEDERQVENFRRKEREEAHLYMTVGVVNEEPFYSHCGFDLLPPDSVAFRQFRVKKSGTFRDLEELVAQAFGSPIHHNRLWSLANRDNSTMRMEPVDVRIRPLEIDSDCEKTLQDLAEEPPWKLFLEIKPLNLSETHVPIQPFDSEKQINLFFKYYDLNNETLSYVGHKYVDINSVTPSDLWPELCKLAKLEETVPLKLFEEVRPCQIDSAKGNNVPLNKAFDELMTGDILVFQKDVTDNPLTNSSDLATVKDFYKCMYNSIDIFFIEKNAMCEDPGICIACNMKWSVQKICHVLSMRIGEDPEKIQLYKVVKQGANYTDQLVPMKATYETIKDIFLSTLSARNRINHARKIYYEVFSIKLHEFENRRKMSVSFFSYENKEEKDYIVYPLKTGTVHDLLIEVARQAGFRNKDQLAKLRLVDVSTLKCTQIFENEMSLERIAGNKHCRVEEMPQEQMHLSNDEMLIGVANYHKDVLSLFGIPFYIKIKMQESLRSMKEKVIKFMGFTEKELEKIKIYLIENNKVLTMDDEQVINLQPCKVKENCTPHIGPTVFLGIDHANKAMKRPRHYYEKSIQIHN